MVRTLLPGILVALVIGGAACSEYVSTVEDTSALDAVDIAPEDVPVTDVAADWPDTVFPDTPADGEPLETDGAGEDLVPTDTAPPDAAPEAETEEPQYWTQVLNAPFDDNAVLKSIWGAGPDQACA